MPLGRKRPPGTEPPLQATVGDASPASALAPDAAEMSSKVNMSSDTPVLVPTIRRAKTESSAQEDSSSRTPGGERQTPRAFDKMTASILNSAVGTDSHVEITYQRRSSMEREYVEGMLVIHRKKPRKPLFLHRSTYFVTCDSTDPILRAYNSEARSELIYELSLVGAAIKFETVNAAGVVMEKCFCLEVQHSWKKRNVLNYGRQGFIVYEENQERVTRWVKCIHLAIKNASMMPLDRSLFRSSATSTMSFESRASDDEADGSHRTTMSVTEDELLHDDHHHEDCLGSPSSRRYRTGSATPTSPGQFFEMNVKRSSQTVRSPTSKDAKPSTPRLDSVFAELKSPSSSASASSTPEKTSKARSFKEKASQLPPKIMTGLHMAKSGLQGKATSSRGPQGVTSPSNCKRLSEQLHLRKRDDSGRESSRFGGIYPLFSSKSLRRGKHPTPGTTQSDVHHDEDSVPNHRFQTVDEFIGAVSELIEPPVAGSRLPIHLKRLLLLMGCGIAGTLETSVFFPVASAGVMEYCNDSEHSNDFKSASMGAVIAYVAGRIQLSLGLCLAVGIVYAWSYADFKTERRTQRNRIIEQLRVEEQAQFSHVDVPGWFRLPDVDRVQWVNKVFTNGWPYIKIAIRDSLLYSLNPLLDAQKPAFANSLSIVRLDLGQKPPCVVGVKFVETADGSPEAITIDIEVRIEEDKDLLAEVRLESNLGAAVVVTLREVFLFGTLRLTLQPLCTFWPCFSGLSLSFTQRPVVDFSLTAAKINVLKMPYASEWLHTFLHDLLADYFIWPKVVHIPLWEDYQPTATATV
ncbi:hypothetical protein Poli38472_012199 [Pythium oligandrum]|uniref:SMP-LTD domain-containing protein n=1 Tax=Pythium oligandrum TaxID=41045 RepID=A0A8K1CQE7_PYTOL|nr:hypothetical protein Poli38472_012199 [Pythium oligandrum]|eukprot:TMW67083.1 hypothetical protein Poli38472_012199 [Pythium oligandrum]